MGHYMRGEIWIPLEDWYRFLQQFSPKTDAEVSYGPPEYREGDCIAVPYACNTDCHPGDEAEPPAWMPKRHRAV